MCSTVSAVVEQVLAGADQPAVHPDIVVVIPHRCLLADEPDPLGEEPEMLGVGPLSMEDLRRLTDLTTVSALTVDDEGRPLKLSGKHRFRSSLLDTVASAAADEREGRPLNLGRNQRLASPDQWTVLWYRDRGCVIPGCHRPASWCQAHHLAWWERDQGPTDLDNLCLVFRHHHHLIHDQHWTIRQDPSGTWQLTRPDGTDVDRPRYGNERPRGRPPD